jgi:hypothetical protein
MLRVETAATPYREIVLLVRIVFFVWSSRSRVLALARRPRVRDVTLTATLRHPASLRPSHHVRVVSFVACDSPFLTSSVATSCGNATDCHGLALSDRLDEIQNLAKTHPPSPSRTPSVATSCSNWKFSTCSALAPAAPAQSRCHVRCLSPSEWRS